jgi:ribose-phosphate pyrophosphokinase
MAELLLLAEAARQWGARTVGLVAPYLPFMRQDAVMQDGEAVTARSFAKIISRSFEYRYTERGYSSQEEKYAPTPGATPRKTVTRGSPSIPGVHSLPV